MSKIYISPTGKQLDERDRKAYGPFRKKVASANEKSYRPLGRALLLDLQQENQTGCDGIYRFFKRIEKLGSLESLKDSEFLGEAQKTHLSESMLDVEVKLEKQAQINKANLYQRVILNGDVFHNTGKSLVKVALGCRTLNGLRTALFEEFSIPEYISNSK